MPKRSDTKFTTITRRIDDNVTVHCFPKGHKYEGVSFWQQSSTSDIDEAAQLLSAEPINPRNPQGAVSPLPDLKAGRFLYVKLPIEFGRRNGIFLLTEILNSFKESFPADVVEQDNLLTRFAFEENQIRGSGLSKSQKQAKFKRLLKWYAAEYEKLSKASVKELNEASRRSRISTKNKGRKKKLVKNPKRRSTRLRYAARLRAENS